MRPLFTFLAIAAGMFIAIYFLKFLGADGVVILASIVVTYLILPIVARFARQMPLIWAIVLTYVLIAILMTLVVTLVVPPLVAQARALIASLPQLFASLQRVLADPANPVVRRLPPDVRAYLADLPNQMNVLVAKYGIDFAQRTLGVLLSAVSLFLSVIIVPILAAYLFIDTGELKRAFLGFVPQAARLRTAAILADLNAVIGAFVRGQVLDGIILAVMVTIMLWALHVPYALLIGVAAGFLNLVPYLGAIVGFIPSVLLALVANGWENALIVAGLFALIQQVDGNFILPRIMKSNVLLSPLIIILSILIFSALFGVMGTFLAVPVAAMLRVIKLHFTPAPNPQELEAIESGARGLSVF